MSPSLKADGRFPQPGVFSFLYCISLISHSQHLITNTVFSYFISSHLSVHLLQNLSSVKVWTWSLLFLCIFSSQHSTQPQQVLNGGPSKVHCWGVMRVIGESISESVLPWSLETNLKNPLHDVFSQGVSFHPLSAPCLDAVKLLFLLCFKRTILN